MSGLSLGADGGTIAKVESRGGETNLREMLGLS